MFKRPKRERIFPRHIKWVLILPEGCMIPLTTAPKAIAGGFITKNGKRYVRCQGRSFNRVRVIKNQRDKL